jgi:hypothetical protein
MKRSVIFLLATFLTAPTFANDLSNAMKAYKDGNYEDAFKIFSQYANNGSVIAQ